MNHPRDDDASSDALRAEPVSQAGKTTPVRRWLAAGALAGAGLLGGVAVGAAGLFVLPGSEQASPRPSVLATYRAEDTLAAFAGPSSDYDPLRSPEALAALSQVVVQGTVERVREGRTGTGIDTIVLIVDADSVVKGELPPDSDGNVYLELPGANRPDPELFGANRAAPELPGTNNPDLAYYTKGLPKGARVVAYMVPAWDGTPREGTDATIENPNAGRPDGQALYLPAGPQGLALQVGEQDVVWPLIGARAPGKIADTLPGGGLIAE
jgi:hypothetical protein